MFSLIFFASPFTPGPQADFHKLPFEDVSFDHVYAIESTCHSPVCHVPFPGTWSSICVCQWLALGMCLC